MANRPPKNRVIRISLYQDNHNYLFRYTDLIDDSDASVLVMINNDRVAWVLDPAISPRTFQIDFGVVNPFTPGIPLSLRGSDSIVAPPLDFPFTTYAGSRFIKYSVSLANGWSDDPDIVPAPGDPVIVVALTSPSTVIDWVDPATKQQIYLTPVNMTADATGSGGLAKVLWSWPHGSKYGQPFSLQFQNGANPGIPAGWPTDTQYSVPVNSVPAIQCYLPAGYNQPTPFIVATTSGDGNPISVPGWLLIS